MGFLAFIVIKIIIIIIAWIFIIQDAFWHDLHQWIFLLFGIIVTSWLQLLLSENTKGNCKDSYEAPLWWYAVTCGIQLDALTFQPKLHHECTTPVYRSWNFFPEKKLGGNGTHNLHNSGVMLYQLSN